MKPKIKEVIVVEGRYDKNTLLQLIDATIITLEGFSIFHDREKIALLRRLADKRGLIILTDSDGAGFVLRSFLKGSLPKEKIKQAYIPDIFGKERRKRTSGKEGKIGVEGMKPEILLESLRRAGATFSDLLNEKKQVCTSSDNSPITKADFFVWGLSGNENSAKKRKKLLQKLSLPQHMSTNALLQALNLLYTKQELENILQNF